MELTRSRFKVSGLGIWTTHRLGSPIWIAPLILCFFLFGTARIGIGKLAYLHVYMYTYLHIYIFTFLHIHIHIHIHIHVYIYIYVRISIHLDVHMT